MKIKLFYFTSTGNTLWVAQQITKNFESAGHQVECYDVVIHASEQTNDCDLLGIVYPVWGSTLPYPLRNFVSSLPEGNQQQVFLIGNTGLASGDTGIYWKNIINEKGYNVIYANHVFLPINCVFPGFDFVKTPAPHKKEKMLQKAKLDLQKMCDDVLNGNRKYRGTNLLANLLGKGQRSSFDDYLEKTKELIYIDQERCKACQLCYRMCPVEAIHRSEDHKSLQINSEKCIMCLKCYNLCPSTAVLIKPDSVNTKRYTRYKGVDKSIKPVLYR